MKDGQPITGELVKLSQRAEDPRMCDVEVLHKTEDKAATPTVESAQAESRRLTGGGPAQVATKAYRDQWTRVFGGDKTPSPKDMN